MKKQNVRCDRPPPTSSPEARRDPLGGAYIQRRLHAMWRKALARFRDHIEADTRTRHGDPT
jgi:hypothetical protein